MTDGPDFDRAFRQLCHFAALNKTDMVTGAVANLVATTLALDVRTDHRGADSIAAAAFVLFGVQLEADQVAGAIRMLLEQARINRSMEGLLQLSAVEAQSIAGRIGAARTLEMTVREEWLSEIGSLLPDDSLKDALWACLGTYLALAFRRHGAETIQLLAPAVSTRPPEGTLTGYLLDAINSSGLREHKDLAREALDVFFAHSTPSRSEYLAQALDGTFTFFAVTLDEATTHYLQTSLKPLTVFLDTNYIFGLLDLHDNVFAQASKELVRFIHDTQLPFRLCYHEYTYAEITRTLSFQADRLRSRRWSGELSRAAVITEASVGLERLYHRLNAQTPTDVEVFLSRYENVALLLEPLGLDIYREGSGPPFTLEQKALFIASYKVYVDGRSPRERSYSALDHDAAVWLAVQRHRTPGTPVLDSGAIFLTNDYWFHRFDRGLRAGEFGGGSGGVVLPSQLLQLLRPLVPATDDFDRRFVEAFALPEFRTIQSGYSLTTSKVLNYLATYKDLPAETAVKILRNHALASRVKQLDERSPEFREAVESALVESNRALMEEKLSLEEQLERAHAQAAAPSLPAILADAPATLLGQGSDELKSLQDRVEEVESLNRRLVRGIRWAVAGILLVCGSLAIVFGPGLVGWSALVNQQHASGIKVAAIAALASLCWAVASSHGRRGALGFAGAAVVAIAQWVF